MSKILKRKYRSKRGEFKNDLYQRCKDNKTLAVLIVQTYTSWHHRRHIMRIWSMMFWNPEYDAFRRDYNQNLMGKHLSGRDDIWRSLYFSERDLYEKFKYHIPETYAMGDAISVAYAVMKTK
ncbi:hypothetical protein JUJ52_02950 [Virgibacillus sp. AGTR]|uniref:hypothetical protein n=1 Tax=Virgibacillus sp. AGTR TaxID=2812055 RepID=UPI001D15E9BA|nr:hypothetical protein [Virgibacillus sp. AGTR]MCC2248915.1 hypothetical protein [Virgibacillus sp. AGTR]